MGCGCDLPRQGQKIAEVGHQNDGYKWQGDCHPAFSKAALNPEDEVLDAESQTNECWKGSERQRLEEPIG
jgi:hypothetical protein